MKLDNDLQQFLESALEEKPNVTVEISFHRLLTEAESAYLNDKLKPLGFFAGNQYCETCEELSDGERPFHIDKRELRWLRQ